MAEVSWWGSNKINSEIKKRKRKLRLVAMASSLPSFLGEGVVVCFFITS